MGQSIINGIHNSSTLGEFAEELRKDQGLETQQAAADLVGVSASTISRYENGQTPAPLPYLAKLSVRLVAKVTANGERKVSDELKELLCEKIVQACTWYDTPRDPLPSWQAIEDCANEDVKQGQPADDHEPLAVSLADNTPQYDRLQVNRLPSANPSNVISNLHLELKRFLTNWTADISTFVSQRVWPIVVFVVFIVAMAITYLGGFWSDYGALTVSLVGAGVAAIYCSFYTFFEESDLYKRGNSQVRTFELPRPWSRIWFYIIPLVTLSWSGSHIYQAQQSSIDINVLLAEFEFDGPEAPPLLVNETVSEQLTLALADYDYVTVKQLNRTITGNEGSEKARAIGQRRGANIVIWGWYGTNNEQILLSVHFEVLNHNQANFIGDQLGLNTQSHTVVTAPNSFDFTLQFSQELSSLTHFTVGLIRSLAKDWDGAIIHLSVALRETVEAKSNLVLERGAIYLHRGNAYLAKAKYDRAILDYNDAVTVSSENAVISEASITNRGVAYTAIGEYDRAIADYDEAISINPDNRWALLLNRGVAYVQKGEYDRAIAGYDEAIRLDSFDTDATYNYFLNRGAANYYKKEYDLAIIDYTKAIQLDSGRAPAYYSRGNAHISNKQIDIAMADFSEAIQANPDFVSTYQSRGVLYFAGKEYDLAMADFDKVIQLDQNHFEAYVGRGNIYFIKKEYDRAIDEYDQAIKIDPDNAKAYFNRGNVYLFKKMPDNARVDLNKVLKLSDDPKLRKEVEKKLEELRSGQYP